MPQLDPTWFASQLFWLVVCFFVLYLLVSRVFLPPLQGVMASRKGAVDADLAAAQDFKSQAELARQSYEQTLAQSRASAQAVIADAANTSKEQAASAMKALDVQVATQLANADKQIAAKKQELLSELAPKTSEFAALIAEKLTAQKPSEDMVKRAVQSLA